jgi:hypothetical protein
MKPLNGGKVAFEPYPFDIRPLRVQIHCKRMSESSFHDVDSFRRKYFQAEYGILQYELV